MERLIEYLTNELEKKSGYTKDWGFYTLENDCRLFYDFNNGISIWIRKDLQLLNVYDNNDWKTGDDLKEPIMEVLKGITFTDEEIEECINRGE